jgi:hypothetical protein
MVSALPRSADVDWVRYDDLITATGCFSKEHHAFDNGVAFGVFIPYRHSVNQVMAVV